MTLTEFVTARLAEDEAAAKETADADAEFWSDIKGDGTHFARHDPARALREVEAGRKILAEYAFVARLDGSGTEEYASGWAQGLGMALRAQTAIWSDHPDYDPAWGNQPG